MEHGAGSLHLARQHALKTVLFTLFAGALATTTTTVTAQIQFPVAGPTPKLGEIVKYRQTDLWNNTELSTNESELVEIEAANFVIRFKSSINPQPVTIRADRSWNFCRSMQNSDKPVCDGQYKCPTQVGNKHGYEKQPFPNGLGYQGASCEVKAEEKVTVPAGTFDTLRITCSGFYNRVFDGNWSGKFNNISWYAPSIGRMVKFQYFDFNPNGAAFNKQQTELTEFIPGK